MIVLFGYLNNKSTTLLILPFLVVLYQILLRILRYPDFVNHDVALYLQCAQLILEGKLPYIDFIDILPPFVFYFFVPPVWFASLVNLKLPIATGLYAWIFILYSLLASFLVLRTRIMAKEQSLLAPLLFSSLILNLPLFYHFAQKEHIFILTFLPFFLMRWLRRQDKQFNKVLAVTIGIFAAIGICLKPPYFLLVTIAPEIYWFIINKKILQRFKDSEVTACILLTASYSLFLLSFAPQPMREAFWGRWAPLALTGYSAYFCSLNNLFSFASLDGCTISSPWIIFLVCLIALALRKQNSLMMPLFIWTLAGWLIFLIQQKGWAYHPIVMMSGYFILANLELAILSNWIVRKGFTVFNVQQKFGDILVVIFLVYALLLEICLPFLIRDSFTTSMLTIANPLRKSILRYTHERDRILIISSYVYPAYPCLIQTNRKSASRYLHLYPLAMYEFLKYHAKDKVERTQYEHGEQRVIEEAYEDIKNTHPKLIAVPPYSLIENGSSTMLSYLQNRDFESALKGYCPINPQNGYFVWIRK